MENEFKIKMGLEIHQQLEGNRKLFCNCPPILRKDKPDFEVKRKIHAVAGESGEIDIATKYEFGKDKEFIYQGYDTTCLVELDEEPPHLINQEALQIALHISLLLNCEIFPITQIMRKTVINGSNTSGFQRTVFIARDGYVETKFGKVGIIGVFLEEDAARPASVEEQDDLELENFKIYKLDRLGIPLVEIVTSPDIKSAEQAKEIALYIGDVLRSCNVKRGIGTIRQDINVSIEGHPRIEIKGFQDPKMMIKTVELEIERQKQNLILLSKDNNLLKNELKSEVRNANIDGTTSFLRPMPGAARMYPETDLPLLRIKKEIIDEAKKTLPKLRSEIRGELTKKGLHEDQVKILLKNKKLEDFESLLNIINDPKFIFKVLIEIPKEIARHENIENIDEKITLDIIDSILDYVKENKIEKQDIKHIIEEIAKGKSFEDAIKLEKIDLVDIESEIMKIVKEKPGLSIGGYMGLIMGKFKGKVSGKEVTEILQKLISK
ncbi:MAG TPA: Glu-tRNA(Gln) amidotransferase subunit GatE [Candidatus Nanoarchaeia archaeon]|nr:Glu-tRNA(Gln) amidotransferase subunit GatE [Candidatus Nanoarchaeia archaeon]